MKKIFFALVGIFMLTGVVPAQAAITVGSGSVSGDGAVALQPASGSNLNITLATTGDLAVNTNQLYVDTSTGYVGIGTTTPSTKLNVSGGTSQFEGNISVGTYAPISGSMIYARKGGSLDASAVGVEVYMDVTPTCSCVPAGISSVLFTNGSQNLFGIKNGDFQVFANHTGTLNNIKGLNIYTATDGPSLTTSAYGIDSYLWINNSTTTAYGMKLEGSVDSGTTTSFYGLHLGVPGGAATITNSYGLYVEPYTHGTNNVGLVVGEVTGTKQTNILVGTTTVPTGSYSVYNVSVDGNLTAGPTNYGPTATSTTAFTLAVPLPALTDGAMVTFKVHAASTGASTLNVNSLGAKKLLKGSDNATQINSGELVVNGSYMAIYNSTLDSSAGAWVVIGK